MDITLLFVLVSCQCVLPLSANVPPKSTNLDDYKVQMEEARNLSDTFNRALKKLDKKMRPNAGGPPVIVTVEFKIISIGEIKEANMEYSMDIFFRQWWTDPQLAHNSSTPINIAEDATKLIWTPDTYFWNVKAAKYHHVTRSNMRLKIRSDGLVYFSTRITFTAQCDMDLRMYPMDIQQCPLIIESYAHTTDDVDYIWKKSANGKSGGIEIVSAEMAQFEFVKTETFVKSQTNSKGAFASLRAIFTFKRRFSYFISATYVPAIILVVLSWCCFWIPKAAVPARITLSITTILTTILLYGSVNSNMPKVSYSKALDYFLMTSLGFIFVALLEFILVLNLDPVFYWHRRRDFLKEKMGNLYKKEEPAENLIAMMDRGRAPEVVMIPDGQHEHTPACRERLLKAVEDQMEKRKVKEEKPKPLASTHWIDRASRVLFPIAYLIFCVYYLFHYGTRPESALQLF